MTRTRAADPTGSSRRPSSRFWPRASLNPYGSSPSDSDARSDSKDRQLPALMSWPGWLVTLPDTKRGQGDLPERPADRLALGAEALVRPAVGRLPRAVPVPPVGEPGHDLEGRWTIGAYEDRDRWVGPPAARHLDVVPRAVVRRRRCGPEGLDQLDRLGAASSTSVSARMVPSM